MSGKPNSSRFYPALLSWMIALPAAWCAVSTQAWGQTLLIAALGVTYLLFPPPGNLPRPIFLLSIFLLLLGAVSFLPATWFGDSFRKPLIDHGIVLPWTHSPQPWISWEDWTLLAAGLLWAWNCFETGLSGEHRQFLLGRYLFGLVAVAAATILHRLVPGQSIPGVILQVGQFMNRNQTGDLLVFGGILSLSLGRYKLAQDKSAAIFWIILTLIFVSAMILNGSRASLALFAFGLIILFAQTLRDPRQRLTLAVIIILVLLAGALIFFSPNSELRHRFDEGPKDKEDRYPRLFGCGGDDQNAPLGWESDWEISRAYSISAALTARVSSQERGHPRE